MAILAVDTHAIIWYLTQSSRLSRLAHGAITRAVQARDRVYVCSITLVEARYLVERGRIPAEALERLITELTRTDTIFVLLPLDLASALALEHIPRDMVPDMPDRIIAAAAVHLGVPLVTADEKIRAAPIETIW